MSSGNQDGQSRCQSPIDAGTLADYWIAQWPAADEEAIEKHLLACDGCGDRLREVMALAKGIRKLALEGSLRMIVSEEFVRRAEAEGLRVRQYSPPSGGSVQCTVTADDDLIIGRLAANLSDAQRVDLSICDGRGLEQVRLQDIPAHTRTRMVAFQESMTFAKAAPSNTMIARLLAIDESGGETLVGEYTFNHTRTIPGPAAW